MTEEYYLIKVIIFLNFYETQKTFDFCSFQLLITMTSGFKYKWEKVREYLKYIRILEKISYFFSNFSAPNVVVVLGKAPNTLGTMSRGVITNEYLKNLLSHLEKLVFLFYNFKTPIELYKIIDDEFFSFCFKANWANSFSPFHPLYSTCHQPSWLHIHPNSWI